MIASKNKAKKNLLSVICSLLSNKGGFTLMELLVVISIIAILISIGLTSFSTVQKKARDSKRKSDIKEVQNSLEQYYSVCGSQYPVPTDFYAQGIVCSLPSLAIMPTVPTDPRGTTPYFCGPTPAAGNCTSTGYNICTMLEGESPNIFCVNNQQ